MATQSGFSNSKMFGQSRHMTVQPVGSNRIGTPTAQLALFDLNAIDLQIASVAVSNKTSKRLKIEFTTPHNANTEDVVRILSGSLTAWEYEIAEVVDTTTVIVYHTGILSGVPVAPQIGDIANTMRWITSKVSSSGESSVSINSAPTQYNYDGVDQTVIQDTTDDSKNRAMPSLTFTIKDGVQVPINEDNAFPINNTTLPSGMYIKKEGVDVPVSDSVTPANVVAVPVKIMSVGGTDINITAGDINVNTTDMGVNFDSMRFGDGSGKYIGITADDEAEVYDAKSKAVLDSIDLKTPALVAGKLPVDTGLLQGLTDVELRATPVDVLGPLTDAELRATALPVVGPLTDTELRATALPVVGPLTDTELRATALPVIGPLTDTELRATALPVVGPLTDVELRASAVDIAATQLPATLGSKVSADSLAVTLSTEQETILSDIKTAVEASAASTNTGGVSQVQAVVGITAVRATVAGTAPNAARKKLMIKPSKDNTGAMYLGSSTVTTANGMEIIGPDRLEFVVDASDYYLVSDKAGQICEIIEVV